MSDSISLFFDAWSVEEASVRLEKITNAVIATVQYSDPRVPDGVRGNEALSDYVGMFSANAPGWSAKVLKNDAIGGVTRSTVAFCGPGPDGKEATQLGQYFVEQENGQIARMVGFVGTGEQ